MAAKRIHLGIALGVITVLALIGLFAFGLRGGDSDGDAAGGRAQSPGSKDEKSATEPAGPAGERRPLPPGPRITVTGVVRDVLTRDPVAGVEVLFRAPIGELGAHTDDHGHYSAELAPGRYQVRAVGDDVATFGSTWLALAADSAAGELDLDVVRLAVVKGRVVNGEGNALADVLIEYRTDLLGRVFASADTEPAGTAVTEAGGGFSIRVPPGEVELIATADGRPRASTTVRWVAPASQISGVEIVMNAGGTVSGEVRDAEGNSVAGATVNAGALTAKTEADGRFRLAAVPAGKLVLTAEAPGHGASAPVEITVVAGVQRSGVQLVLRPESVYAGTVTGGGKPVAGANVEIWAGRRRLGGATSAVDGTFRAGSLPAGSFELTVRADGYAQLFRRGVEVPDAAAKLELVGAASVAGTVTNAAGDPVPGFVVRLMGRRGELPDALRFATADGSYRIDGLAPGPNRLTIAAAGYAPATLTVELVSGETAQGSVTLTEAGGISGVVTNASNGMPVPGALVTMSTGRVGEVGYTDEDGRFQVDDIAPGRRTVEVKHPGFATRMETGVVVPAGSRVEIKMELAPLAAGEGAKVEFAGIGAVMGMEADNKLTVRQALEGGPAAIAGVMAGDVIDAIDGQEVARMKFADTIEAIRGVVGTVVRLRLIRGTAPAFTLDVVRGTVRFSPDDVRR